MGGWLGKLIGRVCQQTLCPSGTALAAPEKNERPEAALITEDRDTNVSRPEGPVLRDPLEARVKRAPTRGKESSEAVGLDMRGGSRKIGDEGGCRTFPCQASPLALLPSRANRLTILRPGFSLSRDRSQAPSGPSHPRFARTGPPLTTSLSPGLRLVLSGRSTFVAQPSIRRLASVGICW